MAGSNSRPSTGRVSNWYLETEMDLFLKDVKPGDAIEIKRGFYSHWGIYVGDVVVHEQLKHCIVHASSPENANSVNVILTSASIQKRANDLGIVQLETIEDAAKGCRIRINNSMDDKQPPLDQKTIVKRAFAAIQEYDEYHLIKNNCEHFATWCRNGVKKSCQVDELWGSVSLAGAVAGALVLFSVVVGRNIPY